MNPYLNKYLSAKHEREVIFEEILSKFGGKPIRVLEIGSTRDMAIESIYGDGWSTFSWVNYIGKRGGAIRVVDVSNQALVNCKTMLGDFANGIDIEFINDIGVNQINDTYDLIYLDGGDDQNEMVEELSKIDRKKSYVLCDDFGSKGIAAQTAFPDWEEKRCAGGHLMALYNKL